MKKVSKQNNNLKSFKRTYFKSAFIFLLAFMLVMGSSLVAFATSGGGNIDATLNNFVDLLFSLIRVVGFIMTAWGLIQLIMSLNSHDPNQRVQGAFFLVGGLIIFFVKEILQTIGVTI